MYLYIKVLKYNIIFKIFSIDLGCVFVGTAVSKYNPMILNDTYQ